MIKKILSILVTLRTKKYSSLIKFVRDRPAHDYRYALTIINKLLNIKKFNFDKINETIEWYISIIKLEKN